MIKLTCDDKHIYRTPQGIIVPNVTTILDREGYVDFSNVPEHLLIPAQQRGNHVHKACELADKNKLDYEKSDPALLPYVEAWCNFLRDYKAKIIKIEMIVHSEIWNFCGALDRILKIKGVNGVYDIKTGAGCSLQTAGYLIGVNEQYPELKVKERAFVKLSADGKYKFELHKDKSEISLFKSIVKTHNSRKKYIRGA